MLEFKPVGKSASEKTEIFSVVSGDLELGRIAFFGRWRKYCFYPNINTLYDHWCLTEIATFCKTETNKIFKR